MNGNLKLDLQSGMDVVLTCCFFFSICDLFMQSNNDRRESLCVFGWCDLRKYGVAVPVGAVGVLACGILYVLLAIFQISNACASFAMFLTFYLSTCYLLQIHSISSCGR